MLAGILCSVLGTLAGAVVGGANTLSLISTDLSRTWSPG